ncbi:MAG: hypothetical protein L6Q76_27000 [Polyangiaceae bacterium]|nr:hypothetical protein [Polyangiaceae bacterium]
MIRFSSHDGFEIRVREEGAHGAREPAGEAIAYRREGGFSYWTKTRAGVYEEWLLLDAGQAWQDRTAASWTVEGAEVRQHGEIVLVVDSDGAPKLRIAAPISFAASGRVVSTKLVAASPHRIDLYVDGDGEQVLVDPSWELSNTLIVPREDAVMVRLTSSEVLLAGGMNIGGIGVEQAEIYDWKTNAWLPAGSFMEPPAYATMTLLASGKALVVGGYWFTGGSGIIPLALTKLFNPATKTWSVGPSMAGPRAYHCTVRLSSGKVLVVGGIDGENVLASAEIYDPATNKWTLAASMSVARAALECTLLPNGHVLVTNGAVIGSVPTKVVEIYNPSLNQWTMAAPTSRAHFQHKTVLLPDGKVLLVGWFDKSDPNNLNAKPDDAEIYDPASNTWTNTSLMPRRAAGVALTLLANEKVFVIHTEKNPGFASFAQIYDYKNDTWTIAKSPALYHDYANAALLPNGKVLITGSAKADFAEVYDPGTPLGTPCSKGEDCESDICVDGICCDTPCDGGACWACSIAKGAPSDGVCAELPGAACDDGDSCTTKDACGPGGVCSGMPRTCETIDECHEQGSCNPDHGLCESPPKPDGTPCSGGGVCVNGHCTPNIDAASGGVGGGFSGDPTGTAGSCSCRSQGEGSISHSVMSMALALVAAIRRGRRLRSSARIPQP